jgi:hypothetical protein
MAKKNREPRDSPVDLARRAQHARRRVFDSQARFETLSLSRSRSLAIMVFGVDKLIPD